MAEALTLHEDPSSGNCYKIRLTAALVGVPLKSRHYSVARGETRTDTFRAAINPAGRIPVLQIGEGDDARFLPESNAACWYIATGSALIPQDRMAQADMLRWMFFEQYSHEPNIATVRVWLRPENAPNLTEAQRLQLPIRRAAGDAALALMEGQLAHSAFLCGEAATLADLVLYPYTSFAGDAGYDLGAYPHITRWLRAIEGLDGYIGPAT